MKSFLLFLSIYIICFSLQAQTVSSYEINVQFFPDDARMWGYPVEPDAFMRAQALVEFAEISKYTVAFYLHGELKIDSILIENKQIEYNTEKILYNYNYSRVALKVTVLTKNIDLGKKLNIYYSGFMNPSKAGSLSNYMHIAKDSGVYLRSYGYSLWFPVFLQAGEESYKSNFKKVSVTLPRNFKCLVTGKLLSEKTENDVYHAEWQPGLVDIMDVQCTAGKYQIVSKKNIFVYYMDNKANAERILNYIIRLETLYTKHFRSVKDFTSLYVMEMPRYGNISSSNVIGISSDLFNDFEKEIYPKATIAHELVHPYVTIPVKNDNPFSAFVVEGFPSFFQIFALYKTEDKSIFDLKKRMLEVKQSYLKKKESGKSSRGQKLPLEKPILQISYDEIGTYKDNFVLNDRVWLFFYNLWQRMGDEKFDAFLKELFAFNFIDYNNFEQLILKYLPGFSKELDTWLNTNYYPDRLQIK